MVPAMVAAGLLGGGLWGLIPGASGRGSERARSSPRLCSTTSPSSSASIGPRSLAGPAVVWIPGTPPLPAAGWLAHWGTTPGSPRASLRLGRGSHPVDRFAPDPLGIRDRSWAKTREPLSTPACRQSARFCSSWHSLAWPAWPGSEVAGIGHQLQRNLSSGLRLRRDHRGLAGAAAPLGAVLVAFLLAALTVGGDQIQMSLGLPAAIAPMLQGTILFFLLGGDILTRYRITRVTGAG